MFRKKKKKKKFKKGSLKDRSLLKKVISETLFAMKKTRIGSNINNEIKYPKCPQEFINL
tara:strand:+ start:58 stop:234 length:177 start_codon:yes stop_codon:yes gene_type:complete